MTECKHCKNEIKNGDIMECPNCGATFCTDCGKQTKNICPYCYSNLDFVG